MAVAFNNVASVPVTVTVLPAPETIDLSARALTVKKGKTARLNVILPPDTAAGWRFDSENSRIASVNSSGKITGKKKGTTKIIVTAHNGATAECVVTVK